MSHVDGERSENPYIHFHAGMKDLLRFDQVRLLNIFGSVQYGLLYAIIFFFAGITIEYIFPSFRSGAIIQTLINEIILQCIVLIIVIFYVRKFIEAIPGFMTFFPGILDVNSLILKGLVPYGIDEFRGEAMLSLILIGTQINLLKKISLLAVKASTKIFH